MFKQGSRVKVIIISCVALLFVADIVYALYRNGVVHLPGSGGNMVGPITKPDGWGWAKVTPSNATATLDDGGIRIDIVKPGRGLLDIVYFASQASVVNGHKYTVSFSSKSDRNQTMVVTSYRSGGLKENVSLSPEWQLHTYTYIATTRWPQPSRLPAFCLGTTQGSIWIKDVVVKEGAAAQ